MSEAITTTRLDDGERARMLADQLEVTSFGLRQITLQPGQRNRVHRHREQEEVYLVLAGRLTIELEDEPLELGPRELARVPAQVRRRLANRGDEPVVVVAIGAAGEHRRADGEAFLDWDDTEPKRPEDVPLPT
jgi:mannose-6-phosphate isomerase-like protein (cupin superfamily)